MRGYGICTESASKSTKVWNSMCWKKPCAVVLTTWVHRFPSQLALSSVELSERKKFCFFHFFIMAGMVCRSRWNKRLDMVIIRHVKSLLLRRFSVSLPHTTLLSCDDLPLGSFIYYVSINPSIYNILRWVAWTMGQTNCRPRVCCSKYFFTLFIDLGHSKLFIFIFCNFI